MKNKNASMNKGQALAEFALVLPMLLLLVMGTIDLGRAVYYKSAIANASREAVRYGAINYCDNAGISKIAQDYSVGIRDDVKVDGISIKYFTKDEVTTPEYISVSLSYNFVPITPMIGSFLGVDGTIVLNEEATQQIEQTPVCAAK